MASTSSTMTTLAYVMIDGVADVASCLELAMDGVADATVAVGATVGANCSVGNRTIGGLAMGDTVTRLMARGDAKTGDVRTVVGVDGTDIDWATVGNMIDFAVLDGIDTEETEDDMLAFEAGTNVDGNGIEEGLGAIVPD